MGRGGSGNGNGHFRVLSEDEIARLLPQIGRYGFPGDRAKWRALMLVLLNYGPRISEALLLTWADVQWEDPDPDTWTITFPTLKRWRQIKDATGAVIGKERVPRTRTLPLYREVAEALREHFRSCPKGPMVFKTTSVKIGKRVVHDAFRTMLSRAGVPPHRLHDLRHTFVTRFLERTGDLVATRDAAGHANLATTSIYAHCLNLKRQFEKVPAIH